MNTNLKWIYIFLAVTILAGFSAYYLSANPQGSAQNNVQKMNDNVIINSSGTITIGIVDNDAVKQVKRFQPTMDYVASKLSDNFTKYEGTIIVVKSMDNLTDLLIDKKVDLFMESPITAALINNKSGSVPFLIRWKDGVRNYHSIFIVINGSSIKDFHDFVGKTIAFEDPGSTSGYMLPKYYLFQQGFNVNNLNYAFTGSPENTAAWVISGKADVGAISNLDFEKYPASLKDKLKVVVRTFDVPRHVVSHRAGIDPGILDRVKHIFLDMDSDPQGIEILKNFQGTIKYEEMSDDEILNSSKMLELIE